MRLRCSSREAFSVKRINSDGRGQKSEDRKQKAEDRILDFRSAVAGGYGGRVFDFGLNAAEPEKLFWILELGFWIGAFKAEAAIRDK